MKDLKQQQKGFTVVEFLIATTVFSFVILICSMAIIHVGRMYYKGVITNRVQDTARLVVDDVAAAIQFGPRNVDPALFARTQTTEFGGITVNSLCIGTVRYSYAPNAVLGGSSGESNGITTSQHVLWRDVYGSSNCPPLDITQAEPPDSTNGKELLGRGMRLPEFVVEIPAPGEAWRIGVRVVYGDDPALFDDGADFSVCRGVLAGGQFCAVSSLNTSVTKRL